MSPVSIAIEVLIDPFLVLLLSTVTRCVGIYPAAISCRAASIFAHMKISNSTVQTKGMTWSESFAFFMYADFDRNVARNVRSLAPSSVPASSVSRSLPSPRSPSSRNAFASVVVSVPRNVLSVPSTLSTCPPTWKPRSPTATQPTALSYIAFQCPARVRYSVSSEQTVLERVRP